MEQMQFVYGNTHGQSKENHIMFDFDPLLELLGMAQRDIKMLQEQNLSIKLTDSIASLAETIAKLQRTPTDNYEVYGSLLASLFTTYGTLSYRWSEAYDSNLYDECVYPSYYDYYMQLAFIRAHAPDIDGITLERGDVLKLRFRLDSKYAGYAPRIPIPSYGLPDGPIQITGTKGEVADTLYISKQRICFCAS